MSEDKKPTNLQIFLFFIGFVTLFTLVFVLGVIVGKGLSKNETAEIDTPVESRTETADSMPDNNSNDKESVDQDDPDVYRDDVFAEKQEEPESKEIEEDTAATDADTESGTDNEKTMDETAVQQEEKKVEVSKKDTENELGYVKKTETAKLAHDQLPPTEPDGKYTVQVASFRDREGAEKVLSELKSKGYPAFMKTAQINEEEKYYRIRIGTFGSREVAKIYFEVLKNKEKDINGFITTNN